MWESGKLLELQSDELCTLFEFGVVCGHYTCLIYQWYFLGIILGTDLSWWSCICILWIGIGSVLLLFRSHNSPKIFLVMVWSQDCYVIVLGYIWFWDGPLWEDSRPDLRCNSLMIVMVLPWGWFIFGIVLGTCLGIGLGLASLGILKTGLML